MTTIERFGSAAPGFDHPVPVPPPAEETTTRRRWPWILLAVVLALVATFFGTRFAFERHEVTAWQVSENLPVGAALTSQTVRAVRVDDRGLAEDVVTGTRAPRGFARSAIPAGALVTGALVVGTRPELPAETSVVGLSLSPAQAPVGDLAPGDTVTLWATPPTGSGGQANQPLSRRLVADVRVRTTNVTGEGAVLLTVEVPERLTTEITALSTQGRVVVGR